MNRPKVAVVDYGVGNLLSVQRALEHVGAEVTISDDPAALLAAPRVILPGVGAFANGMNELRRRGLDQVAKEVAARGTPLLGICLGMQMLFEESEEFGSTAGLCLIPGRVVPVPPVGADNQPQKIPHIGWNALVPSSRGQSWKGSLLAEVKSGESVYFVHSFMAEPTDAHNRMADCRYGGVAIAAVVGRDNVVGCQFHPEKSGEVGLKLLHAFVQSADVRAAA